MRRTLQSATCHAASQKHASAWSRDVTARRRSAGVVVQPLTALPKITCHSARMLEPPPRLTREGTRVREGTGTEGPAGSGRGSRGSRGSGGRLQGYWAVPRVSGSMLTLYITLSHGTPHHTHTQWRRKSTTSHSLSTSAESSVSESPARISASLELVPGQERTEAFQLALLNPLAHPHDAVAH